MTQLVEALKYKPAGRVFISRWYYLRNPSGSTMSLVSPQPLTEMSTRNISGGGRVTRNKHSILPLSYTSNNMITIEQRYQVFDVYKK